jgi:Asparaginase
MIRGGWSCCVKQSASLCIDRHHATYFGSQRQQPCRRRAAVQTTMGMGAVGGIRNIRDAVRAAALVKDHTHHSLLVGEQAAQFAVDMGLEWSGLTTQDSASLHRNWWAGGCQPNFRKGTVPRPQDGCGPYQRLRCAEGDCAGERAGAARPSAFRCSALHCNIDDWRWSKSSMRTRR